MVVSPRRMQEIEQQIRFAEIQVKGAKLDLALSKRSLKAAQRNFLAHSNYEWANAQDNAARYLLGKVRALDEAQRNLLYWHGQLTIAKGQL